LAAFRELWLNDWIVEFVCDFFATFAAGQSFGWSNLRLCARMSGDVFGAESSHPADAARTHGILELLEALEWPTEAQEIRERWCQFLDATASAEPQTFRVAYPQVLLRELASEAIFCFEASGIRRYKPGTMPGADMLNESWKVFRDSPATYSSWEAERVRRIRNAVLSDCGAIKMQ
jgi:hypothetical protein